VVDTGNWLPGRQVLVSPVSFDAPDWENAQLPVRLTRDQVENSPDILSEQPVSRLREAEYLRYYGHPLYWDGVGLWGPAGYPNALGPADAADMEDRIREVTHSERRASLGDESSHLRSMGEVTGYRIQASDGEIGHVEDFAIDDRSWAIHYLLVDTRNWWPGKHVAVQPSHIERVNWAGSLVSVRLTREEVRGLPELQSNK
jgi:hypothetical protein